MRSVRPTRMSFGLSRCPFLLVSGILLVSACEYRAREEHQITPAESHSVAWLDDSVHAVMAAYEIGALPLHSAVHRLADLVEPTGGLAARPGLSPRAAELLEATRRELRHRAMRSLNSLQ